MSLPVSDSPRFSPAVVLIIAICAVSTGAIFARMADAPPIVIAAYRIGLASVLISPVAFVYGRQEILSLAKKDLMAVFSSGFFLALHFTTWISSLTYTTVASSVVLVNTIPLWVAILSPFIAGEKIGGIMKIGIVVSFIGSFIIGAGDFSVGGNALLGDTLAVVGGICAALYLVMGRRIRARLSLLSYVFLCYGSAAVFLWVGVILSGSKMTGFSFSTNLAFLGMAVIPQIVGHSSYNWALRWLSAGMIAVSLLGEPVGSSVMAYFFFNELPGVATVIGGILVLAGIYISAKGEKKE